MKLQMTSTNRAIVAALVLAVLAFVFWTQLLSPKREEAKKLGTQVETLETSLVQHNAEIAEGEEAKQAFSDEYQRLVVVGKAVPGDDDIASLLVQVNRLADDAGGTFSEIQLSAEGGGGEELPAVPTASGGETPASATEVAASLLPLGATIGPAGLAVMPYSVTFDGDFVQIADFIKGLDSLVKTTDYEVRVDGRMVTVDGFALEADPDEGFPALKASFALTTYLTPPGEGVTGGATPSAPGTETMTPAATTLGATP
jgi:Tfp pilus assembly protein PilO